MENIGWQHCVLFVAKLCTSLLQNTVRIGCLEGRIWFKNKGGLDCRIGGLELDIGGLGSAK